MRRIKGQSSKRLQEDFPTLHKRYWERHFWSVGYGGWSTATLTQEMVDEYLSHHGSEPNTPGNFILE